MQNMKNGIKTARECWLAGPAITPPLHMLLRSLKCTVSTIMTSVMQHHLPSITKPLQHTNELNCITATLHSSRCRHREASCKQELCWLFDFIILFLRIAFDDKIFLIHPDKLVLQFASIHFRYHVQLQSHSFRWTVETIFIRMQSYGKKSTS